MTPPIAASSLPPLLRLDNPVRNYAWGSKSFLARLRGSRKPSAEPEAELWMGDHPSAPSTVEVAGDRVRVDHIDFAADPPPFAQGASPRRGLGFLLKILAAAEPLSLQVHPSADQARAGFAREEEAGVPRDAPHRNYRDGDEKPELVYALEEFTALYGFRRPREIATDLRRLGSALPSTLLDRLEGSDLGDDDLDRRSEEAALRALFGHLLGLRGPDARELVGAASAAGRVAAEPRFRWLVELAERYPDDPSALAPLFANLIVLAPGEALFTAAGTVHSYLGGSAVELMGNSDNVLRCGLTVKHVDPDELSRIVRFESSTVDVLRPEPSAGRSAATVYRGGDSGLRLERFDATDDLEIAPVEGPSILLSTRGSLELSTKDLEVRVRPGESALCLSASAIRIRGTGRLFRASRSRIARLP